MRHEPKFYDNRRPEDSNYPNFAPADFRKTHLIVEAGQYIVNDDGDIMLVTSGNAKYVKDKKENPFVYSINVPFLRAKYIGNNDDSLECANQVRLATKAEINKVRNYKQEGYKMTPTGQGVLL